MKKIFSLLIFAITVYGQQSYFYTGKNYGSEALYNPVYLILNGSFDIDQLSGHSRNIFKIPYAQSAKNVFENLGHPFKSIGEVGWSKFLRSEVFPIGVKKEEGQWWPNYQLHLIGGGMTYTAITEWYKLHNYPQPRLFSLATMATYHILNEVVENGRYRGTNTDPIPDIYLFDVGGIVLFSFDNVNKFFKEDLNLADWSLQPAISLRDGTLQNNGQYFSVKWKIPFFNNEKYHLFYYFGMNGLGGLSYKYNNEESISVGVGLRGKNLYTVDEKGRQLSLNMVWNTGVFYDRNNSLMASVFFSGLTDNMINVNIYPGIINFKNFSTGLWAIYQKNGKVLFGISSEYFFGVCI